MIASIATLGAAIAFVLAVWLTSNVSDSLARAGMFDGLGGIVERGRSVSLQATQWPWAREWPAGEDWQIARYVHDCSRPEDRLLVTWFAPEFNFFSRRAFAAGEATLVPARRPPETFESQALARLQQQSVPIVLAEADQWSAFLMTYPHIAAYLDTRYERAGHADFGPDHDIVIIVDRQRMPTGMDRATGLPCFAS